MITCNCLYIQCIQICARCDFCDRCLKCASVRVGRDGTPRARGGDYRLEIRVLEWLSRARSIVVGFVDLSDTVEDDDE